MKITNPFLPEQGEQSNYGYFIQFTKQLNKVSCVSFALFAAKLMHVSFESRTGNCTNLVEKWLKKTGNCINLVEKWLKNPGYVTRIKLINAANNVDHTASNAAHSAASEVVYSSIYSALSVNFIEKDMKDRLVNYISYLLPKEPKFNNFNITLLKQNPQAYSFLETISKLEDHQVTNEDLFGIRQVFDVLEEVGAPLDPNEFIWDGETTEKHKLLQAIRREFN